MAGFLRKLFGTASPSQPASASTDRDARLRALATQDILVLAGNLGDGIDPNGLTQEKLLAEIERAAKELNENKRHELFVYKRNGQRRLPFFTSTEHAEKFAGEYSKEHNRVYPFQLLGVKGSTLAAMQPCCDVFVPNDRSEDEVEF